MTRFITSHFLIQLLKNNHMTKKDYELIASVILKTDNEYDSIHKLVISLINVFQKDNPKFDSDKFLTACGLNELI